jgi:GTP-binding protein Era
MQNFKSGFGAMLGRTNVGKSTLLNLLVGEKVSIMANKPQTTRTAIRAIVNRDNSQIVFIDTPGIHKPKSKLGETLNETAFAVLSEVDVILFLIDATSKEIGLR